MRDSWAEILERVLRPVRPELERCLGERTAHRVRMRAAAEVRQSALRECEARIEAARYAVFAEGSGVVPAAMTELEREWRKRARPDPEAELRDLWSRIAPPQRVDDKPWQDSASAAWLDAAIALAADTENVRRAERAVERLSAALSAFGVTLSPRVRWRYLEPDVAGLGALLTKPLCVALEACPPLERAPLLAYAEREERRLQGALRDRWPERSGLAEDVGRAAFVDAVWRGSSLDPASNPVSPLRALWLTGYVTGPANADGVVLGIPALGCDVH